MELDISKRVDIPLLKRPRTKITQESRPETNTKDMGVNHINGTTQVVYMTIEYNSRCIAKRSLQITQNRSHLIMTESPSNQSYLHLRV